MDESAASHAKSRKNEVLASDAFRPSSIVEKADC